MPPYVGCKVMSNLKNYKHETLDSSKPFELHFPQKIDLAEKAVHVVPATRRVRGGTCPWRAMLRRMRLLTRF